MHILNFKVHRYYIHIEQHLEGIQNFNTLFKDYK
jgi:hypothetical protein